MIATILQSTPTFHAVAYNEHKVKEGSAVLLEMKNFGHLEKIGYSEPQELQGYLIEYSSSNSRIKNPQFHLAISCKGNEWTDEELLEFAHQYLSEMGYGDPEQPMLIYAHHDTDNNHIHIVTSRVNPQGKKIDDSKERIHSQKVLEKLLNQNTQKKSEKNLEIAKQFDFADVRQFKSILESMGYQCYEKKSDESNPMLYIKKGGMIQTKISIEEIKQLAERNNFNRMPDASERMKWRSIFKKYRDINSDRKSLEKDLRENFGIALIWMGPKDSPFGYQVVDLNKKRVYDGYKILHINNLLKFMSKEEHIKEIETLIDRCLQENPFISTQELNKRLHKIGGYIKKNHFGFGNEKIPLSESLVNTLARNNKIAYRQSFRPASKAEIDILCRFTKFDHPELLKEETFKPGYYKKDEVALLFQLLVNNTGDEKRNAFRNAGYRLIKDNTGVYILNLGNKTILDMTKADIPVTLYSDLLPVQSNKAAVSNANKPTNHNQTRKALRNPLEGVYGGNGQNREWEVGKHGHDKDDPDRQLGLS